MTQRLAIFRRHSLLDGRAATYITPPGDGQGHPFLGRAPFNVGDNFVSLALAKALDVKEFLVLSHSAPARYFDYVNETCDAIIVVSQNSLRPGFFGKFLPARFIEKRIKIPMIFVSLGLQFELDEDPYLEPEDIASMKAIHERCVSSQVRGEASAELLSKYGIDNTRVLGCPSILWELNPRLQTRPPAWDEVGWTITDMGDRPMLNENQMKVMGMVAEQAGKLIPIAQGGELVLQEYVIGRDAISLGHRTDFNVDISVNGEMTEAPRDDYWRHKELPHLMRCKLDRKPLAELAANVSWVYRDMPSKAVEAMLSHGFFSHSIPEYMRHNRGLSLMTGTRLHGNIMALSQGVPCLYTPHDLRVKEMADLFQVPRFDLRYPPDRIDFDDYDWDAFGRVFPSIYQGFKDFFDENGLHHKL